MEPLPTFDLFDVTVTAIDDLTAAEAILTGKIHGCVHFANTHVMSESTRDSSLRSALQAGTVLPDGMPLVWAARRSGLKDLRRRAAGPEVMKDAIDKSQGKQIPHYFLGTNQETLVLLETEILQRWPTATTAGSLAPKYEDVSDTDVSVYANAAKASGADLVWLGLSSPRQNVLAHRLARHTSQTLLCVGAAFDFVAGTKATCPAVLQRLGLEWLFRLATEPRRLFRRYATTIPRFIRLSLKEKR